MKILIVEDNPLIANAIERAGEELAMTSDHATDGWDAIEKLETGDYAAVVVDTDLPRHSGFGVLSYLGEKAGLDLQNVLVVTTSDHDEIRRKLTSRVNVISRTEEVSAIAQAMRVACGH